MEDERELMWAFKLVIILGTGSKDKTANTDISLMFETPRVEKYKTRSFLV